MGIVETIVAAPLDHTVIQLALATALGMFLGLEREWSEKSAGIRTFSLASLLGAVFIFIDEPLLLAIGGLFVATQGILLGIRGIVEAEGLALTTSVSLVVAYGVGALIATGLILEGVAVALISSLLLVLRRELHSFAWGLSREELRSASEFAILAFVIFPLLPSSETIDLGVLTVTIEPRIAWLMVVFVAGLGIINYAIVNLYGGRGLAVIGFFGGLASSTAVVGTVIDHIRQQPGMTSYGVSAVLLANAAMALRNLIIVVLFTFPDFLVGLVVPLGAIVVSSVLIAALNTTWSSDFSLDLDDPFSLRYAIGFGGVFLAILVAGSLANAEFGQIGFYATTGLSGLVSSAGATTSAVILYRGGTLAESTVTIGILLATFMSIVVKASLVVTSQNKAFTRQVAKWSTVIILIGIVFTGLTHSV